MVLGTGCDAWRLHYRMDDPLAHAAGWLRPLADDRRRSTKPRSTAGSTISAAEDRSSRVRRDRDSPPERGGQLGSTGRDPDRAARAATEHTLRVFAAEEYLAALTDRAPSSRNDLARRGRPARAGAGVPRGTLRGGRPDARAHGGSGLSRRARPVDGHAVPRLLLSHPRFAHVPAAAEVDGDVSRRVAPGTLCLRRSSCCSDGRSSSAS